MMIQTKSTAPKTMMKVQLPPNDGDPVGEPLAESQLLLEFLADVLGKNFVLLQAVDHFLVERGQLADLVLQHFLDVIAPEMPEIVEANEALRIEVRARASG